MFLQEKVVKFREKEYNQTEIKELTNSLKEELPEILGLFISRGLSNIFDGKLRPCSRKNKDRFDYHFSSGSTGKKSLSFFCKLEDNLINIVVLGSHKYEKKRNNKKKNDCSTTYKILYQTLEDKQKFGSGIINLNL